MALPTKHIKHQLPVLATLGETALKAVLQSRRKGEQAPLETPTPAIKKTLSPRDPLLIKDYVRHVGGDPSVYKKIVPPHLFPQWGFPLAAKTLTSLPYPMAKVLNGGCRIEINGQLPQGQPLEVSARLENIDDNGRRAVLHQIVETGTKENPRLLVGHLYAIIPLSSKKEGKKKSNGSSKKVQRVPLDAREIGYWSLPSNAGLAFAMLTGDFNPVHWIPPYAKAFGFKNTILHGFSTMARSMEGVNRTLFAGRSDGIKTFDVQFTKPLVLPAKVGLYVQMNAEKNRIFVGDAKGGPAYLVGTFETA